MYCKWLRNVDRYRYANGTSTSQQLLEMVKVRGLAIVQSEERHSSTNQVIVKDNKHRVGSGSQMVTILDWMVPDLCSRCVAMKLDLQGIHEDCGGMLISSDINEDRGGMIISSKMEQRSVNIEAASKIVRLWKKR